VQVEKAVERGAEGVGRRAVAVKDRGVVAPPGGKVVPVEEAEEGCFDGGFGG
jgi:hypothetical protein